jgi:predicted nucleotidyltransferase
MAINKIKQKIIPILTKHGVKRASLFGSLVRGDFKRSSDIDILVEVDLKMDLLDFISLKLELENVLRKKVDLVEFSTVKPFLREEILLNQFSIL